MTTDTPASAVGVATALTDPSTTWPDELWTGSVSFVDAILRSYYGIHEFTDDPTCIFRIGLGRLRAPVLLADGTRIEPGEVIGTLHFWNEHLPPYSAGGPDFGWASTIRRQLVHSLRALADYVATEPAWQEVRALRGEAMLSHRPGAAQLQRLVERFGIERAPGDPSFLRRLQYLGESCAVWGLTRAFNPAALPRQPFLRDRHDLWISRSALLHRYGRRQLRGVAEMARPHGQ